jgi:hypothetical protein
MICCSCGDAVAFGEHRTVRAVIRFCAGEVMWDTVIVMSDIDVIIDTGAARAPFSEDAGFCR